MQLLYYQSHCALRSKPDDSGALAGNWQMSHDFQFAVGALWSLSAWQSSKESVYLLLAFSGSVSAVQRFSVANIRRLSHVVGASRLLNASSQ